MKKSLVLALVVVFVLGLASTAFASDVTLKGDTRIRYVDNDGDGAFAQRVRLHLNADVNDDISFTASYRIANHTGFGVREDRKDDLGGDDPYLYDAYVTHKNFLGGTAKLGRQSYVVGQMGYFLDSTGGFDGIDYAFGSDEVTVHLAGFDAGKLYGGTDADAKSDIMIAKIDAKVGENLGLKAFYIDPRSIDYTVVGVGFAYALNDDWKLSGDYVMEDWTNAAKDIKDPKDLHVRLAYKGLKASEVGSWGAHVEYIDWEGEEMVNGEYGGMIGSVRETETIAVQFGYTVAENVTFEAAYANKDPKAGGDKYDYTRAQLNYMF